MRDWKQVRMATDMAIYFCDPHAPWQRGTNENTNGLLRQYFPKGTDLSVHSAADLDWVAAELNDRPRKRLAFRKPIEEIKPLLLRWPLGSADPPTKVSLLEVFVSSPARKMMLVSQQVFQVGTRVSSKWGSCRGEPNRI